MEKMDGLLDQKDQFSKQINDFRKKEIELLKQGNLQTENEKIASLEDSIRTHETTINNLNAEIANLGRMRTEYDTVKHQVQHLDTFRNNLAAAQQENNDLRNSYEAQIKELNDKIDYLNLTPAKRKKIDEAKAQQVETLTVDSVANTEIKDGGLF